MGQTQIHRFVMCIVSSMRRKLGWMEEAMPWQPQIPGKPSRHWLQLQIPGNPGHHRQPAICLQPMIRVRRYFRPAGQWQLPTVSSSPNTCSKPAARHFPSPVGKPSQVVGNLRCPILGVIVVIGRMRSDRCPQCLRPLLATWEIPGTTHLELVQALRSLTTL